jgi:FkbM family methyltransferase
MRHFDMKPLPKTSFLNQARLFANKMLSPVGVEIVRRPCRQVSGLVPIRIGDYQISMHENNTLWAQYFRDPEYTGELGRLARSVFQAYPEGLMIDVGANVGDTAAIVRTAVDVPIVCIEGDPGVFPLLQQNIAPMKDVTAHQCFLGEKTETIKATIEKNGWDATIIPAAGETKVSAASITLQTLDEFVSKLSPPGKCKLLKVDVEGFDLKVLRGATGLLREARPVILFEWNHENLEKIGDTGLGIFSYLQTLEYQDLMIFDGGGYFILPGEVSDSQLLQDLYDYARSLSPKALFYYDICAFHKDDSAIAQRFLGAERFRRKSSNGGVPASP